MSKFLSSVGIGSAEVDTILPTDTVAPGQSLDATVEVEGGSSEQDVEQISFALVTKYQTEEGYSSGTIDRFALAEDFTISPEESRTESVTVDVPYRTPLTMGRTEVWVKTGLDIDWAIDPKDKDYLEVRPDDRLQALIDAVEELGFSFHTADVMSSTHGAFTARSFVQELEFKPRSGPFSGRLDEIEIVPMPSADGIEVVVEVDKRGGLFEEMGDWDESKTSLQFDHADADRLTDELHTAIDRRA
jgi:sporulation-control protein